MISRVITIATIGALSVLVGCANNQQLLSPTSSADLQAANLKNRPQSASWGVGAGGNAYSQPNYFFTYCSTQIYLNPAPSSVCANPIYEYGKRKVSVSYSTGSVPCNYGAGTCSASLGTTVKLGTISTNAAASESPPDDYTDTSANTEQASAFIDRVTVTSNTLPYGTSVRLKESVQLSGTFGIACTDSNYGTYQFQDRNAVVWGDCESGAFVQHPSGNKSVYKFTSNVGDSFQINPELITSLTVDACTSRNGSKCVFGPTSASLQITKATYRLSSITPNVTLVSASGKSY